MSTFLKVLFILMALKLIVHVYIPNGNNVCKTFTDYYFPEGNENCYYDPDGLLETPELIKKYAGIVETHEVTSEDGYVLTMFRIPAPNPKGVILIHHSIATYSQVYFFQGNDSLAITLWRNGFDVWLANQRGTSYSNRHVNMTKRDYGYWNFSFHEMGIYDVSSELELIREKTNNSQVTYFGHSLGGTIGLVYASLKSFDAVKYLKNMILVTPATTMQFPTITYGIGKILFPILEFVTNILQSGSPLIGLHFIVAASRIFMRFFPPIQIIAVLLLWFLCGFTPEETDPLIGSSHFKMYDYGLENNVEVYGNGSAPLYPLENIMVPTLIISSARDVLVPQIDCENVFGKLSQQAKLYGHWKISELNHLDFLAGLSRQKVVFERLTFLLKTDL
ncbi:hypothetical protein Zmor_011392 [Zophobas morio]|uniref:AB hydrolase-1 domain-containing protein n=1 Tax=Zophobas morio TaxID=2755281 RepID=A0AA38IQQ8_9CUCU|nr:hypothetical protein Zmor_011392 [Zophobas morio]